MYGLMSLCCPLGSDAFARQAWNNLHCQGVGFTPWRASGVPLTSLWRRFGVALSVEQCTLLRDRIYGLASLWRRFGGAWNSLLLHVRCGIICTAKGSDLHRGVLLTSL